MHRHKQCSHWDGRLAVGNVRGVLLRVGDGQEPGQDYSGTSQRKGRDWSGVDAVGRLHGGDCTYGSGTFLSRMYERIAPGWLVAGAIYGLAPGDDGGGRHGCDAMASAIQRHRLYLSPVWNLRFSSTSHTRPSCPTAERESAPRLFGYLEPLQSSEVLTLFSTSDRAVLAGRG